jgi:hypothetical protein
LCRSLGSREVERPNVSVSISGSNERAEGRTLSYSRDEVALYKPAELASRLGMTDDRLGVRLAVFTHGDAYELVWPHFPMPKLRPAHCPATWLAGKRPASDSSRSDLRAGALGRQAGDAPATGAAQGVGGGEGAQSPASASAVDDYSSLDALADLFGNLGDEVPPETGCEPDEPEQIRLAKSASSDPMSPGWSSGTVVECDGDFRVPIARVGRAKKEEP